MNCEKCGNEMTYHIPYIALDGYWQCDLCEYVPDCAHKWEMITWTEWFSLYKCSLCGKKSETTTMPKKRKARYNKRANT